LHCVAVAHQGLLQKKRGKPTAKKAIEKNAAGSASLRSSGVAAVLVAKSEQ
jgi:hypothetical protein